MATKKKQRKYQRRKWETMLNPQENEDAQKLLHFLYDNGILDSDSRYGLVKFLIVFGVEILYNQRLLDIMTELAKKKKIKFGNVKDTFKYVAHYGFNTLEEELK